MTLFAPSTEAAVPLGTPRLHAFVIGVANYPHLIGGDGSLAKNPLNLPQITTPQYTAAAIADWLVTQYNNPAAPLGSVELLISQAPVSPPTATRAVPAVAPATIANIEASFNAWERRARSHPDNIALFYFCGHGLQQVFQFLLAEDFGDPTRRDSWDNCIAFDEMRVGMRSCPAQKQLFFVDACRQVSQGALQQTPKGKRFISSDATDDLEHWAVYNATTEGGEALGPADDMTYFCQALLASLSGVAAQKSSGKYVVDSFSLSNALGQLMTHSGKRYNQRLGCNPSPNGPAFVIHETSGLRVYAVVGCSTKAANTVADIELAKGTTRVHSPVGEPKPMYEIVESGAWTIAVDFPGGEYQAPPPKVDELIPPVYEWTVL